MFSLIRPALALVLVAGIAHQARAGDDISKLRETALYGESLEAKGNAVLALVENGSADAVGVLLDIESQGRAPELVRTWAAAGAVQSAKSLDELSKMSDLLTRHAALERPFRLAATSMMDGDANVEAMLVFSVKSPKLRDAFSQTLARADASEMANVMFAHENNEVRRLAAGYLASRNDAAADVIDVYRYQSDGAQVPWQGGALYVPSLGWSRGQAKTLMGHLTAWHLHCDRHGLDQEKQQIFNNLRSVGIWRQAGSSQRPANDTLTLLQQYAKLVGVQTVASMLKAQGVRHDPKYAGVLEGR